MSAHLDLPVYAQRERILRELEHNQVIVVESPTGSGKTTQLPLILHEAGYASRGIIGVTQPRRIAAVSVSDYIARQLGVTIPDIVGYKMRFYDKTSPATRIKILTDGMLLQEMKLDPLASDYSVMVVDEAHERSLNIDFVLGLLKQVLEKRSDFKVIISSATINPGVFSEYFSGCPIIHIDAELFPVSVRFKPPERSDEEALIDRITELVEEHVTTKKAGDILVFLSGEFLINACMDALDASRHAKSMVLLPLFGRLSKEQQDRVFIPTPEGKTKVVVSTNIAETSITINNISLVIDSGLAKLNYYNQRTFTSSLIETPISRASCNQRKGRAGRTMPGVCWRLYTKHDFNTRPLFTEEEIRRTDLSEVVLRMAELGIRDFEAFDFLTPPEGEGIHSAVHTLQMLDALDANHELTRIGEMMSLFPLLPRHARIIIEAIIRYPQVLEEAIIATAFLSTRSPFILVPGKEIEARHAHHSFSSSHGDFVSYLKLYRSYRGISGLKEREHFCTSSYLDIQIMEEIVNITEQLTEIVSEQQIPILSDGPVRDYLCSVAAGLVQFVCVRTGRGVYRTLTAERIYIHPGSVMFRESPEYIVSGEIVKTSRMYARSVSPLKREWLTELFPAFSHWIEKPKRTAAAKRREEAEKRQSGNTIMLWNSEIEVVPYKGKKKLAILPLETLRRVPPGQLVPSRSFRAMRGKITFGSYDIHVGDKITSLVKIVPYLRPEDGIYQGVPTQSFTMVKHVRELTDHLYLLLKLCRIKKKSSVLGFITLETNGKRVFWFKTVKSFHTAIDVTLSSLEQMADQVIGEAAESDIAKINQAYRQVSEIFEHY